MSASPTTRRLLRALSIGTALALVDRSAPAQVLPWEITVAEIEAGRLRSLAQRLSKQNLLYQFHLGDVRKPDLVETAEEIDRVLRTLETGSPSYSIPAPWTRALRKQLAQLDRVWGPLRRIAVVSPYEYFRVSREFAPQRGRGADPFLVLRFDELSMDVVAESEKLLALYDEECVKTGLEVCPTARASGYAAMLIERATKEAVYIVAGIDADENRARLEDTIEAYRTMRRENDESPFFAAALDPKRGVSAKATGELLTSLREDWDAMQTQLTILAAGDEKNFDLRRLLETQSRLVGKVERMTAALVRYASLVYGS
jgi:hypothetical protein